MRPVLTMTERTAEREPRFTGITEHSHTLLTCSACGEDLLDIMVTEPNIDVTTKVRATCPFCSDRSLPELIRGGFCVGRTDKVVYVSDQHLDADDCDMNVIFHTVEVPFGNPKP